MSYRYLSVSDRPTLRRPVLLVGFTGWGDAGAGASGAVKYLLGDPSPAACAVLDPEACFDFSVERPITKRGRDGRWRLTYPRIRFQAVIREDAAHDLLIMRGPEPHKNWPTLAREAASFAAELGVELAITLGAFIGAVSHRRTPLMRRTPNRELDQRLADLGLDDTSYSGPTAFVTAMLHALDDAGVPAASIWAAGPPYLGSPNPSLSLALLRGTQDVVDEPLGLDRLEKMSEEFVKKVEEALRENPEVAGKLGKLVDLTEQAAPDEPPDLPSGADLVNDLEQFLRENRGE
ncbi:MAG: PAC2 family protein [Chloroflexota bacterium]